MGLSTLLDAIERTLSSTLERGPLRIFQARLEPVHVVRHLERLLDRHSLVTDDGVIVPHEMVVRLNPDDESRLMSAGSNVPADIAARLQRSMRTHGRRVLGPVSVHIEADSSVPVGQIRAEVIRSDPPETDADVPLAATSRIPVVTRVGPGVRITMPDGDVVSFAKEVVSIGRSAENDIVIPDSQVSRHHAELHVNAASLELRDLESTNGTWVQGARIKSIPLTCPARVRIGGAEIQIDTPRA
jgi:hypothetical protein